MLISALRRLKDSELENRRLKLMCSNLHLEDLLLNDIVENNCKAKRAASLGRACPKCLWAD